MQLWIKRSGTQQLPCHSLPIFPSLASFTGAERNMGNLEEDERECFPLFS